MSGVHGTATRAPRAGLGVTKVAGLIAALALVASAAVATTPAGAAEEPVNLALASGENPPATEVSYVPGWNSAAALNNGVTGPTNTLSAMWGTWGAPGNPTQDIATYTWERPVSVSSSALYLWQNHLTPGGDSGVMIPASWKLEYRTSAGEWMPMTGAQLAYPLPVLDTAAPVSSLPVVRASFDAVTTDAVRLVLDRVVFDGQRKATSVIEWQVWGVNAPVTEPEPEDPNAFIDAQAVAVRTITGAEPDMPERVWVIGENGPLRYVDVDWDSIPASDYATAGAFEVTGDPAGYDGQTVAATVFVAADFSDEIDSIDYAATITVPGVPPVLPETVRATYDDGTASSAVEVRWDAIAAAEYASADAIFDVAGAVVGHAPGAVATVFVVEPVNQTAPVVSLAFETAPQGSGWYTAAPVVTVTAEATASPVRSIQYSLDGETWTDYAEPFAVAREGDVTVRARATSEDGAVGAASESIKVDTVAPITDVSWELVDGSSALFTLTPRDEEPGSGVTRTVWSDGPDPSPTGELNNMYATYEEPFSVQLTEQPRYVHVQTQDAAGNNEDHVTIVLPTLAEVGLDLETAVSHRCVAGKSHLVVTVTNADDDAADVLIRTPFGVKALTGLDAGRTASNAFASRLAAAPDGVVEVTGIAGERTFAVTVEFAPHSCHRP